MDVSSCRHRLQFLGEGNINEYSPHEQTKSAKLKITLKQHQLTMVYAMRELESCNVLLENGSTIHSSVGICADCVGSGKSLAILAHICENPSYTPHEKVCGQFGSFLYVKTNTLNNAIKSNLIVVPHACVSQWISYIKDYTDLSHSVITKRKDIDNFNVDMHETHDGVVLCSSSMYNSFIDLHRRIHWTRVVFDEADTINIPAARAPSANFVWFVTSSLQNLLFPSGAYFVQTKLPNSERYIVTRKFIEGIRKVGYIRDIFRTLETKNADQIISKIVLKNNDAFVANSFCLQDPVVNIVQCRTPAYMQVLLGIVNDDIISMLNAGNIDGAIDRIGCSIESHENVIDSVTQSYRIRLSNAKHELTYVNSLESVRNTEQDVHNRRLDSLTHTIADLERKISSIKERVKAFKDSTCPICFDNHTQPAIVGCCQNVYCFECITRSLQTRSVCPMCRSNVCRDNITIIGTPTILQVPTLPSKDDALRTILDNTPNGKFLVFSSHDQSFQYIETVLQSSGQDFVKLLGSINRINSIINRYKNGNLNVLMLNSSHYGTGLNLENTTDLVFYHKMPHDMERQVIGRAQRSGRTQALNVHYLYQENELT